MRGDRLRHVLRRATVVALGLLVLLAGAAAADPAKPSNYRSTVVDEPAADVRVEVQGGDSFLVADVPEGTELLVPGYDDDEQFDDVLELEQYARVLPDGTVQLNSRSAAYYLNAARYGAATEGQVGPDVPPLWETVATDGRLAWHDHRIHWMSPRLPPSVDPGAGVQEVQEYLVPLVVDGELAVAGGTLQYVPDRSPLVVLGVALVALVGGVVLARRSLAAGALAAAATGGTATALLVASTVGRAAGFEVATPPIALLAIGALAPLLGTGISTLRAGQRRGLVALGGLALLVAGVLASGVLDPALGGGPTGDGGFGNWWLRPTLPVDVLPELLRYALVAGTGVGLSLLAVVVTEAVAAGSDLDGLDGARAEGGDATAAGA